MHSLFLKSCRCHIKRLLIDVAINNLLHATLSMAFTNQSRVHGNSLPGAVNMEIKKLFRLSPLIALMVLAPVAGHAENTFGIQFGGGIANEHAHHLDKADIALTWDPHLEFWELGSWGFKVLGEAHAAYWHINQADQNGNIGEFGLSPVLRFERNKGYFRPYVEGSVGIRFLSHPSFASNYTMSSSFQFADMLGVGLAFGNKEQYAVGYRFQHLSNASIKEPNPGVDFHIVYFQYNFI